MHRYCNNDQNIFKKESETLRSLYSIPLYLYNIQIYVYYINLYVRNGHCNLTIRGIFVKFCETIYFTTNSIHFLTNI